MSAPSKAAAFAKRRLIRDLKELQRETSLFQNVAALPTSNIFEWHCNMRPHEGPYAGTVFHLILKFGQRYPQTPPTVLLCTSIKHPNVFGRADYKNVIHPYVCLDMLKEYYTNTPYVGWSSAYSVTSILLQLQSFLFAETVPQDYGGDEKVSWYLTKEKINEAIYHARHFSCQALDADNDTVCHTHDNPWPPFPKYQSGVSPHLSEILARSLFRSAGHRSKRPILGETASSTQSFSTSPLPLDLDMRCEESWPPLPKYQDETAMTGVETSPQPLLVDVDMSREESSCATALAVPTAVYAHVFGYLAPSDLFKARDVCKDWRRAIVTYNIFERSQISCFHTKKTLDDEACILGVGLNVEFYQNGGRGGKALKEASSILDILSFEAFHEQGVRTGVWDKERFEHFLPLVLNPTHARLAGPVIEQAVYRIMKQVPPPHQRNNANFFAPSFEPHMIWNLLSTLMNTTVIHLMKDIGNDSDGLGCGEIRRHASEKALEGYCAFHHMLLYFARKYPSIETMANRQVDDFIRSEENRRKSKTPNLGNLLVCLTLSQKGWTSLWKPLMLETFDRNVRWLLQKHPSLENLHAVDNEDTRTRLTFEGTITSLRLLMFQVYFMSNIGRPACSRGPHDVLTNYDKRCGRPTTAQKEDLQEACKQILAVGRWTDFFARCQVPVLSKDKLVSVLKQAVMNSRNKNYHGRPPARPQKRRNNNGPAPRHRRQRGRY